MDLFVCIYRFSLIQNNNRILLAPNQLDGCPWKRSWLMIYCPCSLIVNQIYHRIDGMLLAYSYFKKGCQKKCTRQTRKVLWVVVSSLFFKEIWKNGTRVHGHVFASVKGKQQKEIRQYSVRNSVVIISHITFQGCRGKFFSNNLSQNSGIPNMVSACWFNLRSGSIFVSLCK